MSAAAVARPVKRARHRLSKVANARGNAVAHPALAIERSAQSEIRTWGDRFDPTRAKRRART